MRNITLKPKHFLVILLLGAGAYGLTKRYESAGRDHVATIPPGFQSLPLVREDRLFSTQRDEDGTVTIHSAEFTGAPARVLLRNPSGGRLLGVRKGSVYCLVSRDLAADIPLAPDELKSLTVHPERASAVKENGRIVRGRRRPAPSAPGSTRSVHMRQSTLKSIPVDGGPEKEVCGDISGDQVAVAGDSLFWIEQGLTADWTEADQSAAAGAAQRPSRILAIPLAGGEPRAVMEATGVIMLRRAGESGLFVYVREARGARTGDLHFIRPDGTRVGTYAKFPASATTPVELKGRLYWIDDSETPASPASGNQNASRPQSPKQALFSALSDGSDRKAILDFPATRELGKFADITSQRGGPTLRSHKGNLYVILNPETGIGPRQADSKSRALFRIQPGSKEPMHEVMKLPTGSASGLFDGDYFYYSVPEQQDSWLSWSSDNQAVKNTVELYRIRLAD